MENEDLKPEIKQFSVVLIGDFNPAMFSPEWFGKNHIIAPEDVEFALMPSSNPIVSAAITIFATQQLNIKIDNRRFQVVTNKEPLIVMKDFIVRTFENLNNYTISAFGFNYAAHYKIDSISEYHKVGDLLAPKKYWASLLGEDISGDDRRGGLATIQMQEEKNDEDGQISIILQPSNIIKPGFYMSCNDHTNLNEDDCTAENLIEQVDKKFETSYEKMKSIQTTVLKEVISER